MCRQGSRSVAPAIRSGASTPQAQSPDQQEGVAPIYRDIPEALRRSIEPVVVDHGCELVDVELSRSRGAGLLRIIVDSPQGDGRVPIERCVAISREVETLLDAEDVMPGSYQLEVSSPGLDRILGREKDFRAAIDREIKLRTRRPIEGRKRFRGRLLAVEPAAIGSGSGAGTIIKLAVDGIEAEIPFEEVEKANIVYEFSAADFAKPKWRDRSSRQSGKRGGV